MRWFLFVLCLSSFSIFKSHVYFDGNRIIKKEKSKVNRVNDLNSKLNLSKNKMLIYVRVWLIYYFVIHLFSLNFPIIKIHFCCLYFYHWNCIYFWYKVLNFIRYCFLFRMIHSRTLLFNYSIFWIYIYFFLLFYFK